jgi:hypothetical protein
MINRDPSQDLSGSHCSIQGNDVRLINSCCYEVLKERLVGSMLLPAADKLLEAKNYHSAAETVTDEIQLSDAFVATVINLTAHVSHQLLESSEGNSVSSLSNDKIGQPLE